MSDPRRGGSWQGGPVLEIDACLLLPFPEVDAAAAAAAAAGDEGFSFCFRHICNHIAYFLPGHLHVDRIGVCIVVSICRSGGTYRPRRFLCWAYGFVPRRYMPVMRSCRGCGPSSHGCRGCAKKGREGQKNDRTHRATACQEGIFEPR